MIPAWLAHPGWLLLLLVLPVVGVLRFLARRRRQRALLEMGSLPMREPWFTLRSGMRWLFGLGSSLMFACLVLGIAGPQWGREWGQSGSAGRDVVVVLDLSRSMFARDVHPSRVGRAKEAVLELLANSIEPKGGYRIGLVVFAAKARVLCPLTHDIGHFREVLDRLDPEKPPADLLPTSAGESGTRIGAGLLEAVALHDSSVHGGQDILLFSDGDDPGTDSAGERALGIGAAREKRIPVHVIGIGDPEHDTDVPFEYGTPVLTRLKEAPLKDIARATAGVYVPIHPGRTPDMGRLFEEQMAHDLRERQEDAVPVYRQRYEWFCGAALGLLALGFLVQVRWRKALAFRWPRAKSRGQDSPAESANKGALVSVAIAAAVLLFLGAGEGSEWLELVRRGNEAFGKQEYEAADRLYAQAEEAALDPGLVAYDRGVVAYRLGQYAAAESFYRRALGDAEGQRRLDSLQGLADSLVRQDLGTGPLHEAIHCYRACLQEFDDELQHEPEHRDDIRNNLDLAKLLYLRAEAAERQRNQQQQPEPGNTEQPRRDPPSGNQGDETGDPRAPGTRPDPKRGAAHVQPQPGKEPIPTDQQAGGVGRLPPVPDSDELVPLSPETAAAHLRAAAERLRRQMRSIEKSAGAPVGVLDR